MKTDSQKLKLSEFVEGPITNKGKCIFIYRCVCVVCVCVHVPMVCVWFVCVRMPHIRLCVCTCDFDDLFFVFRCVPSVQELGKIVSHCQRSCLSAITFSSV